MNTGWHHLAGQLALAGLVAGLAPGGQGADSEPPTRPLQLTLTAKTGSSVSLSWSVSTDNVAVVAYEVLCEGRPVGSSPSNAFLCCGLEPGQSRTFRVRARDAAGNISPPSNALLATPEAGGLTSPPAVVRTNFSAIVLNYDPFVLVDGTRRRVGEHRGHRDVGALIARYIELMRKASGGQMNWSVTSRFDLDEWAPGEGSPSPVFHATNGVALLEQGHEYGASYAALLHDPRFDIIGRANRGELDAVWIFGAPGVGFWETAMAGPSPYWINGAETVEPALRSNIVFYGFGKEGHQGVAFMCENTCHMTEVILRDRLGPTWPLSVASRVFNTLNPDNPARALTSRFVNAWTHFTQAEAASWDPVLVAPGGAQAGLSHFPPVALHNCNWSTRVLDFENPGPFRVCDDVWSIDEGEYHVLPGDGVKAVAVDEMTLADELGDYHPLAAFSDADVELTVRVMNGAAPSHAGFLFRVSTCAAGPDRVRGYYVGLDVFRDRLILARLDNAFFPLAHAPCALDTNVPYRLRIEARGGHIRAYLNDSLAPLISFLDSSHLTGDSVSPRTERKHSSMTSASRPTRRAPPTSGTAIRSARRPPATSRRWNGTATGRSRWTPSTHGGGSTCRRTAAGTMPPTSRTARARWFSTHGGRTSTTTTGSA